MQMSWGSGMMRPHGKRWFQYGILSWDNNIDPQFYGTGGKSKSRFPFLPEIFQLYLRESLLSASGSRKSRQEKSVVLTAAIVSVALSTSSCGRNAFQTAKPDVNSLKLLHFPCLPSPFTNGHTIEADGYHNKLDSCIGTKKEGFSGFLSAKSFSKISLKKGAGN